MRLARSGAVGAGGAVSGLSAHFAAGSSQLIHWKSVRPEMVITATVCLPHFAQRVGRSMAFSRFYLKPENRNACSTSMLYRVSPKCSQATIYFAQKADEVRDGRYRTRDRPGRQCRQELELTIIYGCSSGYIYCSSSDRSISKNGDADMARTRTHS